MMKKNTMMKENPQTVTNKKNHKERLRRCIGCRISNRKESMIRFVKDESGKAVLDRSMNMEGRGTYVCRNAECLNNAIKRNATAPTEDNSSNVLSFILSIKIPIELILFYNPFFSGFILTDVDRFTV